MNKEIRVKKRKKKVNNKFPVKIKVRAKLSAWTLQFCGVHTRLNRTIPIDSQKLVYCVSKSKTTEKMKNINANLHTFRSFAFS